MFIFVLRGREFEGEEPEGMCNIKLFWKRRWQLPTDLVLAHGLIHWMKGIKEYSYWLMGWEKSK